MRKMREKGKECEGVGRGFESKVGVDVREGRIVGLQFEKAQFKINTSEDPMGWNEVAESEGRVEKEKHVAPAN